MKTQTRGDLCRPFHAKASNSTSIFNLQGVVVDLLKRNSTITYSAHNYADTFAALIILIMFIYRVFASSSLKLICPLCRHRNGKPRGAYSCQLAPSRVVDTSCSSLPPELDRWQLMFPRILDQVVQEIRRYAAFSSKATADLVMAASLFTVTR